MRAKPRPVRIAAALLLGAGLAACARQTPPPEPVVEEMGEGLLRLAATGPTAAAAVEAGLNHATRYCAARNGMIAVEGTQIERRGYQLRFRCLETGTPGEGIVAQASPAPQPLAAPPVAGPVSAVTGEPLAPPPSAVAAPALAAPPPPAAPVAPSGLVLPGAARALPPIAAGAPTVAPRPAPAASPQPPSGFWQTGR